MGVDNEKHFTGLEVPEILHGKGCRVLSFSRFVFSCVCSVIVYMYKSCLDIT